jgi:hypothetical protein
VKKIPFVIVVSILFSVPAWAANYHVLKGASGNGTSWSNAWGDLNNISGLAAGDTVYIGKGSGNYTGSITYSVSGSSGSPITIKRATIAEHGSATGWSDTYDGIVTIVAGAGVTTFKTNGYSYITIDGVDRTKFLLNGNKAGEYGVELAASYGHNNRLLNATIYDYYHKGVYADENGGGLELAYCDIYHNGDEARVQDTSHNVTFFNNTGAYGWNNVHHNKVYDGGNYANPNGLEDNIDVWATSLYINIYNNEVFINSAWGCSDSSRDMIWVSGDYANIYNNLIYSTGGSCTTQSMFMPGYGTIEHLFVYNNVIYKPIPGSGGFGILVSTELAGGYINDANIYNNIIYGYTYPIAVIEGGYTNHITNVSIKNNILRSNNSSTAEITLFQSTIQADVTSDYNYYDSGSGGPIINIAGTSYYMNSPPSGWDAHSAEGNPQFDSIGISGFHPTSSSPTRDVGVNLNSIFTTDKNGDVRGSLWDIGAYEYEYGGDTTPPGIFDPSPGSVPSGTTLTTVSVSTTEAATCRYSTTPGTSYDSMTHTFAGGGGSSHSSVVGSITYSDAFTRANENPLANGWTKSGSSKNAMKLSSNQATGSTNAAENSSYYSSGTFAADQKSKVAVYGYGTGPMVRVQSGQTYQTGYAAYWEESLTSLRLDVFTALGGNDTLDEIASSYSAGNTLELRVDGNALTVYKNDVLVSGLNATATEFLAGGYAGLAAWYDTQMGDNWEASGLAALADSTTYHFYTRCADGAGNKNLSDFDLSLTVQGGGGGVHTLGSFELQGAIQ